MPKNHQGAHQIFLLTPGDPLGVSLDLLGSYSSSVLPYKSSEDLSKFAVDPYTSAVTPWDPLDIPLDPLGPLGAPFEDPGVRKLRRLERQLFSAWCYWLCYPSRWVALLFSIGPFWHLIKAGFFSRFFRG